MYWIPTPICSGPPGIWKSSREPCRSMRSSVLEGLEFTVGANSEEPFVDTPGTYAPLFNAACAAEGMIPPEKSYCIFAYIKPAEASRSQRVAVQRKSANR